METLSDRVLEEMEKRCVAATPGPWKSYVEGRDHEAGDSFIKTAQEDIYLTNATIADQDFIAHARQDVQELIKEIKNLRKAAQVQKR